MTEDFTLFDLSGRVAVVTGGNRGIGRAIALGLARAGASVAVLARNEEANALVLAELEALGNPALALQLDVTDRGALAAAIDQVERELHGIDILVNNAGNAIPVGGLLNETAASWDATIATHLNASFLMSQLAAKSMLNRGRGKIINLASMYSFFGSSIVPAYSAAKGAIVQLTKSMAIDLAPHNIQVNAIAPGWIETDMTARIRNSPMNEEIILRTPAGRWGQPDEVSGAAIFLASRAADFITGATLAVDGGYSIR
ncbi:MAG TPA: glucose 1-dehydrogenase [Steroidobacteraceae bacterium]|nr:glucose 1-dehydrogenase [Steroidobacteraceae bacterium]